MPSNDLDYNDDDELYSISVLDIFPLRIFLLSGLRSVANFGERLVIKSLTTSTISYQTDDHQCQSNQHIESQTRTLPTAIFDNDYDYGSDQRRISLARCLP